MKKAFAVIVVVVVAGIAIFFVAHHKTANAPAVSQSGQNPTPTPSSGQSPAPTVAAGKLYPPIGDAQARLTKKPFGIYITPSNSPVSPERFTGYHTGDDFEATSAAEANIDVPISAACDGTLLRKDYESGYGGVAVESCSIAGQPVTVVYGHLRLSSIQPSVGQKLKAGDHIAVLGTGYSTETQGERKHLHFGIHKGTAINTSGYVSTKAQLQNWIDPATLLF